VKKLQLILLCLVAAAAIALGYRACSVNRLLVDPNAQREIDKAKQR
jgi:hypothetical protein